MKVNVVRITVNFDGSLTPDKVIGEDTIDKTQYYGGIAMMITGKSVNEILADMRLESVAGRLKI